jgi:hypothetical protein
MTRWTVILDGTGVANAATEATRLAGLLTSYGCTASQHNGTLRLVLTLQAADAPQAAKAALSLLQTVGPRWQITLITVDQAC